MNGPVCNTRTKQIEELAKRFPYETVEGIKNDVALWQLDNGKSQDEYPSASELNKFIKKIRDAEKQLEIALEVINNFNKTPIIKVSSIDEQKDVDLTFDPITRRDRVTLIARMFSGIIDDELKNSISNLQKRIEGSEGLVRLELIEDLKKLLGDNGRWEIIRQNRPSTLFNKIKERNFLDFLNKSEEDKVLAELTRINEKLLAADALDAYTDELKLLAAKEKAKYRTLEYLKIVDHFLPLAEETSHILRATEGIIIDPNGIEPSKVNMTSDDPEGNDQQEELESDWTLEERIKDGWMVNVRLVSARDSLSQRVRAFIRLIPKLDYEGYEEEDDLGNKRYLDPDFVHATLLDKLRNMIDADDMVPMLEELSKTKPWVTQILEELDKDESLFSQFYQDMRKDFTLYWIQKKKKNPDGTYKVETIPLNKPEGVYYLLDSWRDNYESGNILDKDSVYNKKGELSKEKGLIGLNLVEKLINKFNNKTTEQRLELLNDEVVWNDLLKLLHMIAIDPNPSILRSALSNILLIPGIQFTDPIVLFLNDLNVIFDGISKGKIEKRTDSDGEEVNKDLINNFGSAYNNIAKMLADVTDDAIEVNIRENDKSYYAHTNPNYLGKLIKKLKNVNPSKKLSEEDKRKGYTSYFDKVIKEEFQQYDWFYKDGKWLNDWVEKLATDEKYRKILDHKVLLNHDKVDYTDWDSLDYTIAMLEEYKSDPNGETAWYHVPILSDSPSAEFIKFVRIKNGLDEKTGETVGYQDIIIDKMINLVNQEYNRIQLVRARDKDGTVDKIDNYDIKRKDGLIVSKGGSEFKFLPALNSYTIKEKIGVDKENKDIIKSTLFLDKLEEMKKGNSSGDEINDMIRRVLSEIIEDEFEDTYAKWVNIGLLDELPNGHYKHFPHMGMSVSNKPTIKAMQEALKILGTLWTKEMDDLLSKLLSKEVIAINNKEANKVFGKIIDALNNLVNNNIITAPQVTLLARDLQIVNRAKDFLREYFYNSKHATSQIIQLTTTDLAYYKNMEDFLKRYKEVHAPSLRLNTNSKYGRKWERTIYLKDAEIPSPTLDDIIDILDLKVKEGVLSKVSRNAIVDAYKNVNWADALAYRSMSSYRAIMDMSGLWTEAMQRAFDRIRRDEWDMEDFSILWLTKKPYVYTQVSNNSGIDGYTSIKTPVQHKNSEFLLLAGRTIVAAALGKADKLRAIDDFMEKYQIDVVLFESTVKVGGQGKIDINGVDSYNDVMNALEEQTKVKDESWVDNSGLVHKVSYEDYGILTPTPEHCIDHYQLIGTQIRKLIMADISDDATIMVAGRPYKRDKLIDLYNRINTENILGEFMKLSEEFSDIKKVEKLLLEEIRSNQRYGQDMLRACTLDENDNFQIPLYDPVLSLRIQTLINSIIKSRITKLTIRGGSLIQVSSYGLSDKLNIVYDEYTDKKTGEKKKRIKYFECYMPAYSKDFFEPLMDPKTHQLDINMKDKDGKFILPEELRKAIGYRVPTEDKYSMAPLYIKGFLPKLNGSSIMLPAEITTISGSDFDVDKMYVMFPEFTILEYDYDKARSYWLERDVNDENLSLQLWIDKTIALGDPYGIKLPKARIRKVKYNQNKLPQEQSKEARNNMLIDMMWGVLTNEDTAPKILNPGGFDAQKKTARVIACLQGFTEDELRLKLSKHGIQFDKKIERDDGGKKRIIDAPIASYLFDLPLKSKNSLSLEDLVDELKGNIDPLSPFTQVYFHQLNMTGAHLIGIYANHNAHHALMQQTMLGIHPEYGGFTLNGKSLYALNRMTNDNGDYISRLNAGFLAASVDNVKDPVLAYLNQNTFTADASMLLSRLGYDSLEIGLLMNQPVIRDITLTYFREKGTGKSKNDIIDDVIKKYKEKAGLTTDLANTKYADEKFYIEDLADNIILSNSLSNNPRNSSDFRLVEFHSKQVAVAFLFKRILNTSDKLADLVQGTKADTLKGAAGPTIADSIIKMQKLEDFIESTSNKKFPLVECNIIDADLLVDPSKQSKDEIRESILSSQIPMLQAFYTLGLKSTKLVFKEYFPHYSEGFQYVINEIRQQTKLGRLDVKTMNNIYNDLVAYIVSQTPFFGTDDKLTAEQKREKFINDFPEYFKRVVDSNERIASLEFIQRIRQKRKDKRNPVNTVIFKNVGSLSTPLKERYMRDWVSLLYMGEEALELALNMFLYSYFRNGFAFGPSTFIHLAPVALRVLVPDYILILRNIPEMAKTQKYLEFIDLYFLNHLDNRKLVHELSDDSTFNSFIKDELGNINDEILLSVNKLSKPADKKIILEEIETKSSITYVAANYIAFKNGRDFIYYRKIKDLDNNTFIYSRVYPLGFKNSFIEYEWGKSAFEMKSMIKENQEDYDPTADIIGRFVHNDNIDYEDAPDLSSEGAYDDYDGYNESFNEEYGEDIPNIPPPSAEDAPINMNDIPQYEEYKDAKDNLICVNDNNSNIVAKL